MTALVESVETPLDLPPVIEAGPEPAGPATAAPLPRLRRAPGHRRRHRGRGPRGLRIRAHPEEPDRGGRLHRPPGDRGVGVLPHLGVPALPPLRRGPPGGRARGPAPGPSGCVGCSASSLPTGWCCSSPPRCSTPELGIGPGGWKAYASHYLFLQIYFPSQDLKGISAAWSLCVEMTFYLFIPLYAALIGRRRRPAQRRADPPAGAGRPGGPGRSSATAGGSSCSSSSRTTRRTSGWPLSGCRPTSTCSPWVWGWPW